MDPPRSHVLMVTVPAYGHLIPLLELAKKISKHHNVTFVVSESMLQEIRQRELLTDVDFSVVGLADGYIEGPEVLARLIFLGTERHVLPAVQRLFQAIPVRGPPQIHIDDGTHNIAHKITLAVDLVIADALLAGSLAVLSERKIPFYYFNSGASGMTMMALGLSAETPTMRDEDLDIPGRDFPIFEMPSLGSTPVPPPEVIKKLFLPMQQVLPLATGIIANSVKESESMLLLILKARIAAKGKATFRTVGPLSPEQHAKTAQEQKVKTWLDGKQAKSVVYVAFGSIAFPTPEYAREILKALNSLGKPFIWALPERCRGTLPQDVLSQLDSDQMSSESLILDWAPQKLILQHASTAVFVSHCGWNSCLESLASGVPIVAWPMFAEQKMNVEQLHGMGVACLLGVATGSGWKNVVPFDVIQKAVVSAAGFDAPSGAPISSYRTAAEKWKKTIEEALSPQGSSGLNFSELVGFKDITNPK
ncbi:putative UDP-glucose glucosyltransferase [Hypsibius exemplaris]|uniref:UDP-glucuronosyltransferase n=1 Tax=Hypsibius exemplaris TaxID=2072580 RepID=A0A1W0XDX9_HYPEX|nr:putative UDP-glucose glucosyltransferase [Hypsibius exemplaris]